MKVIGGGAWARTSVGIVVKVLTLAESRPLDPPTQGWIAIAYATTAVPGDWSLEVTAICADLPTVDLVTDETSSSSSELKQLDIPCPAGTRILGGGVQVIGPLLPIDLTIRASVPRKVLTATYSWFTQGREWTPTASSWRLRGYALCADIANPYQFIEGEAFITGRELRTSVSCPDDMIEIGYGAGVGGTNLIQRLGPGLTSSGLLMNSVLQGADFMGMSGINICIKPYLFGDGFASGDLSAWSSSQ